MIEHRKVKITCAGADGSAAGHQHVFDGRAGFLRAVAITKHSQPTTTDVVVKANSSSGAALFTHSNVSADQAAIAVVSDGVDESNGSVADIASQAFSDGLYVSIAQGNAGEMDVDLWIEV